MTLSGKVEANSNLYSVLEADAMTRLDRHVISAGGLDREQYC